MSVTILKIVCIILLLGEARAVAEEKDKNSRNNQFYLNHSTIVLSEPIDSANYIIGPGDVFGITIIIVTK